MGWIDVIEILRKTKPDSKKVSRVLALLGLGMVVISGIMYWDFSNEAPDEFPFPPKYLPPLALTQFSIGLLLSISALGIYKRTNWGKLLAQLCLILILIGGLVAFSLMAFFIPSEPLFFKIFSLGISIIVFVIYMLFAYYGIRYIGRLESSENSLSSLAEARRMDMMVSMQSVSSLGMPETTYKYSPFKHGIFLTFSAIVLSFLILAFLAQHFLSPPVTILIFISGFAIIFIGAPAFNRRSSPFEKHRTVLDSFTGGGSIGLFNASAPFMRMLIYEDGMEIRIFFHCFFIPYDKLEELPEKLGFLSTGVPIKSDIPDVPPFIRFAAFRTKKIMNVIREHRQKYLDLKKGATAAF